MVRPKGHVDVVGRVASAMMCRWPHLVPKNRDDYEAGEDASTALMSNA